MQTLTAAAVEVLETASPAEKIERTHRAALAWRRGRLVEIGDTAAPRRPASPMRPPLLPPRDMPKRRAGGGHSTRVALLHALAHIELNAIDLAWDLIARFANADLPRAFFDDWVAVADEEATHHGLLSTRLSELGVAYGDFPAHDGLWAAANETARDLLARLAVVPLVLEARGLDVTPAMIARLRTAGDGRSAEILRVIYRDEIEHVAAGQHWFTWEALRRDVDPVAAYHTLVRRHFRAALKPPFNDAARAEAGLSRAFYAPLAPGS